MNLTLNIKIIINIYIYIKVQKIVFDLNKKVISCTAETGKLERQINIFHVK